MIRQSCGKATAAAAAAALTSSFPVLGGLHELRGLPACDDARELEGKGRPLKS